MTWHLVPYKNVAQLTAMMNVQLCTYSWGQRERERDREREGGGGREVGRERDTDGQTSSSTLCAGKCAMLQYSRVNTGPAKLSAMQIRRSAGYL